MEISSVDFHDYDDDGIPELFIVNGEIIIMNGQGIDGVEDVRQWLADSDLDVPEYSSFMVDIDEKE